MDGRPSSVNDAEYVDISRSISTNVCPSFLLTQVIIQNLLNLDRTTWRIPAYFATYRVKCTAHTIIHTFTPLDERMTPSISSMSLPVPEDGHRLSVSVSLVHRGRFRKFLKVVRHCLENVDDYIFEHRDPQKSVAINQ